MARTPADEASESAGTERALSLFKSGQLDAALSLCQEMLRAEPNNYRFACLAGEIKAKKGSWQEALEEFTRAVRLNPDQSVAYYKRANLFKDLGRLEESLLDYSQAISTDPLFSHAYCNRGVVLQHLRRFEEALDSYRRAIELNPSDALALFNSGGVLLELNRPDDALKSYKQAIAVRSDYAECYCNLGLLQAQLNMFPAALESYDRCIEINPKFSTAHFNRGVLLQALEQQQEALAGYSRVIELDPNHAEAFANRGEVLTKLNQWEAAASDFERAIDLRPDFAQAYFNLGALLAQKGRYQEAIEKCDRAIALRPDYADAHYNRADVLLQMGQYAEAVASYDKAIEGRPERPFVKGMRLFAQMHLCNWTNLDARLDALSKAMHADASVSPPFPLLTLVDEPGLHLRCAQSWVQFQCRIAGVPEVFAKRGPRKKIRIGYFSGDFHIHPVSMLMAGVIESHNRSAFETVAFSYGPHVKDDMRQRMENGFDRFLDVRDIADEEIARISRSLEIDVAIDLAGYTGNGRTKIFAWRAAPIQASYVGYLGTMGAPYMDYLLADPVIIPLAEQHSYSEKIIYLPSYQANDSKRRASDTIYTREQLGLPHGAFVFACFNANYKIMPAIFSSWMRILTRVCGSVLYLYAGDKDAERNLRREAQKSGVDPLRLVFGGKLPFSNYLARYQVMDLFLDTLPYNAGTTASDALWTGLPVLTCAGRGFAGRMAASLLTAINMPELITNTLAEYEALAVELATTPEKMVKIRSKLAFNRVTAPLFDTARITRNLEAAYVAAVERYDSGLEPAHIYVGGATGIADRLEAT